MLIAQISDTHIARQGEKTFGLAPMAENLQRCIDHINQFIPQPDLVLVTGDICNSGRKAELEHAATLLKKLRSPFYVIPGNHDNRLDLLSVFGDVACRANSDNRVNYVIDDFDVRLIALDSCVDGAAGGEISKRSCAWLKQQLEAARDMPVIIFMHHPPINLGVAETNIDGFKGRNRLAKVIKQYPNIEAILCGHIHLAAHSRWQGTLVSTAPSTGMRLVLDLTLEQPSQFILEDPGYQLHYWSAEKSLITHTVKVTDSKSGFPFHPV